jgi:hypothetical protein
MNTTINVAVGPARHISAFGHIGIITGRNLRRLVRIPTLIAFATVQLVLFVLLFIVSTLSVVRPAPHVDHSGLFDGRQDLGPDLLGQRLGGAKTHM